MDYGFVFSQTDNRPMYQQIMDQIKQRIAVGDWPQSTPLPSIRELSAAIKVSVITVKRAYLELEREGIIVTRQGKGSWVNDVIDQNLIQKKILLQLLEKVATLASEIGLSDQEILYMMSQYRK